MRQARIENNLFIYYYRGELKNNFIYLFIEKDVYLKSTTCREDDVHPSFVYYKPQ